jgi:translation initiation factor IF-3
MTTPVVRGKPVRNQTRINNQIRSSELRVIDEAGNNLGVLQFAEALRMAQEQELDLIEISPEAVPPVAKIMSFGKYQYLENKKAKKARTGAKTTELKSLQIKIGTGEHDLELKAKQASKFLKEGHRVRINLYLSGRAKYMDPKFLRERFDRLLKLIPENYKMGGEISKGPRGLTVIIEKQ